MTGLLAVMNSTIASSLPSNAGTSLSTNFPAATTIELVLPVSIFLVGYVVGPMIWGPLSEVQGRKPVLAGSFVLYTVFMLACALAPNFPLLLVFRLLCGANAAAPVVVVGGVYADVFPDPRQRGIAIALLMAVSCAYQQGETHEAVSDRRITHWLTNVVARSPTSDLV